MTAQNVARHWVIDLFLKFLPTVLMGIVSWYAVEVAQIVQEMSVQQAVLNERLSTSLKAIENNRIEIAKNALENFTRTKDRFTTTDAVKLEKNLREAIKDHEERLRLIEARR